MDLRDVITQITKTMADEGRIINGGWEGFQRVVLPPGANEDQKLVLRTTFFAGAQHLFSSIISILEPGADPTKADLSRMDKIHQELEAFKQEFLDLVST